MSRDREYLLGKLKSVLTLVADIVDREHIAYAPHIVVVLIVYVVIDRDKGCLPVVGIDDIRLYFEVFQHLKNGSREERVSFGIVVISVQTEVTLEVILIVDEIVFYPVEGGGENTAVLYSKVSRTSGFIVFT